MDTSTSQTGRHDSDPRLGEALELLDQLPNIVFENLNRVGVGVDPIAPQPRSAWREQLLNGRVEPGWFIRAAHLIALVLAVEPSTTRWQLRLLQGGGEGA